MGKLSSVNSKAQAGRERKEAQKEVKKREEEKKVEERENKEWGIGAKTRSEKQIRDESKKEEKARQQQQKDQLLAAEEAELAKYKPSRPLPKEKPAVARPILSTPRASSNPRLAELRESERDFPLYQHSCPETSLEFSASNVDDALFLLDPSSLSGLPGNKGLERHPERRVKAAFALFEQRELANLKKEFPGLRLSQLKEKLHRLWQKSPENPFNQAYITYNATKNQETLETTTAIEENLERLRVSHK